MDHRERTQAAAIALEVLYTLHQHLIHACDVVEVAVPGITQRQRLVIGCEDRDHDVDEVAVLEVARAELQRDIDRTRRQVGHHQVPPRGASPMVRAGQPCGVDLYALEQRRDLWRRDHHFAGRVRLTIGTRHDRDIDESPCQAARDHPEDRRVQLAFEREHIKQAARCGHRVISSLRKLPRDMSELRRDLLQHPAVPRRLGRDPFAVHRHVEVPLHEEPQTGPFVCGKVAVDVGRRIIERARHTLRVEPHPDHHDRCIGASDFARAAVVLVPARPDEVVQPLLRGQHIDHRAAELVGFALAQLPVLRASLTVRVQLELNLVDAGECEQHARIQLSCLLVEPRGGTRRVLRVAQR